MVNDKEKHVTADLELTDAGPFRLFTSYLCSATIIGTLMQAVMLIIMWGNFYLTDGVTLGSSTVGKVLGLMVISSLLATMVNAVIISGVHAVNTLNKLATIVGTAAGFLVGTYMPIGILPTFAQDLVKFVPGSYVAALYRQYLMAGNLKTAFAGNWIARTHFEQLMGVRLNWSTLLTRPETYRIMGLILIGATVLAFGPVWVRVHRQHQSIQKR